MAKSARIRSAVDGGDRHAGSVEFFPLSLQSVQPWNGDWERHADLFAEYLRDARIGSAVLIHGAIAGVATMLKSHWTNIERVPLEEAMARARQWRRRVVEHALQITSEVEVDVRAEAHPS